MTAYSPPITGFNALNTATQSDDRGGKDYMRSLTRIQRFKLAEGKVIQIVDRNGNAIMSFPLVLFNAASTKKDLVRNDKIVLPSHLSTKQAMRLLELIKQIPKAGYVGDLPAVEDTRVDIEFHSVAEALGMGSFTQRIFDLYFKRVNSRVPVVANIEAIAAVRTPPGDKIYKQMAYHIAVKYFENTLPNPAAFEKYLMTNDRLRTAVEKTVARKQIAAQRSIQHENNNAAFLERERYRQEKARKMAEQENRGKEVQAALRAQRAAEKIKQQEREDKESAVRQTMLEKKRAGQKLNAEEARAHEKLFGKSVAR